MNPNRASLRLLWISSALSLALPGCVLPGAEDGEEGGDSTPAGDSTGAPTTGTDPSDSGGSSGVETGTDGADSSGDGVDSTGDEDPTPAVCSDATLLAGNPYFNGELEGWNPAGQPLLADPPLRMRHLADVGGRLAIETQTEVWLADGADVRRLAGDELEQEVQYQPFGPCADVRVMIGNGIAGLPNGDLVLADTRGNGLIELRDPMGTCTAAPIAGNPEATLEIDLTDDAAAIGDIDGPGADARFYGVQRPVADADGNIYVIDAGNTKVKRVANDAGRTVSTVFDDGGPEEYFVLAMTAMDGMVYVTGQNAVDDMIWAVDPTAPGGEQILFQGRGLFEEIDSSQQATLFAAANDGVDLLLASNKGYIFRVSTAGDALGAVAGIGSIVDFPDIDVSAPVPLDELPLRSYGVGEADLLRLGTNFVFTGNAGGVGFHLWSVNCE